MLIADFVFETSETVDAPFGIRSWWCPRWEHRARSAPEWLWPDPSPVAQPGTLFVATGGQHGTS